MKTLFAAYFFGHVSYIKIIESAVFTRSPHLSDHSHPWNFACFCRAKFEYSYQNSVCENTENTTHDILMTTTKESAFLLVWSTAIVRQELYSDWLKSLITTCISMANSYVTLHFLKALWYFFCLRQVSHVHCNYFLPPPDAPFLAGIVHWQT